MAREDIKGLDRLTNKLLRLPAAMTKNLRREIALGAELIRSEAIKSISKGGRTGVVYKRGGKTGQRSAPGEFPKTDRGRLVISIKTDPVAGTNGLAVKVGTNLRYGRALEFGAPANNLKARPWLARTLKNNAKKIGKKISRELKIVLKRPRP